MHFQLWHDSEQQHPEQRFMFIVAPGEHVLSISFLMHRLLRRGHRVRVPALPAERGRARAWQEEIVIHLMHVQLPRMSAFLPYPLRVGVLVPMFDKLALDISNWVKEAALRAAGLFIATLQSEDCSDGTWLGAVWR